MLAASAAWGTAAGVAAVAFGLNDSALMLVSAGPALRAGSHSGYEGGQRMSPGVEPEGASVAERMNSVSCGRDWVVSGSCLRRAAVEVLGERWAGWQARELKGVAGGRWVDPGGPSGKACSGGGRAAGAAG